MGLFGALYSSVSGLNAQSTAISVGSNNISNFNTIAYKATEVYFSDLVNASSGGVQADTRINVNQQGSIKITNSSTDLAIDGKGFFVVSPTANTNSGGINSSTNFYYTRAGSFSQDALGNYVNSSGFVLYGWPLSSTGLLPGAAGNSDKTASTLLQSLVPINVSSLSSAVAATTNVSLGMTLDATQTVLQGAGETISIGPGFTNANIGLNSLLVPDSYIEEGYNLQVGVGGVNYTYTYGGITASNNITSGILGASNANAIFSQATGGDNFTIGNGTIGTFTFTYVQSAPDVALGQFNSLTTLEEAINLTPGLVASINNNVLYVGPADANQDLTFTDVSGSFVSSLGLSNISAAGASITNQGVVQSNPIASGTPILGATSDTTSFSGATAGDGFSITAGGSTYNFYYSSYSSGPTSSGTFTDLNNLASLISSVGGGNVFDAEAYYDSTTSSYSLYIMPLDPTYTMSFSNLNEVGTSSFATALNLTNTTTTSSSVNRFNNLQGLVNLINQSSLLGTVSTGALSNGQVTIYNSNPLGTIYYTFNRPLPGQSNMLEEFGLTNNAPPATPTGPAYDPTGSSAGNMASGAISPQFSRIIEIYDPLGVGHEFEVSFVKIGTNLWESEIYAVNPSEIVTTNTDGLVAYGQITFNGDGSLRNVASSLTNPITIQWADGASSSSITFNWGTAGEEAGTPGATTIGLKNGLQQIASPYNVEFTTINGASAALLTSIQIDTNGYVIANYANGLSQKVYQLPLAVFTNPDGLQPMDGNIFSSTQASGNYNLQAPGSSGAGTVKSNALEQSNTDLAGELTNIIIAQRGYEANTQVISAANKLLEMLGRIFN